ncbi:MAG: DUF2807 domain-containing protein, partial [Hyphomonadaceae bacterium]
GIGAMFGGTQFIFVVVFDGVGRTSPVVALSAGSAAAQDYEGSDLRLRGVAAHVIITPEDRSDIEVAIDNAAGRTPMPLVTVDGGRVLIDGRLRGRISGCLEDGGADLRGYEDVAGADLPRITIRTPRDVRIDRGGAGTTEIAASNSVEIELSGCSVATIADTSGQLTVDLAGSGTINAGAARSLDADVAGSGEIHTGAVSEGADLDVAGSGRVAIASLNGDLSADGAGSGNITVAAGALSSADIDLAGSGGVEITAPVEALNVSIVGSGDVTVNGVVGNLEAEIAGSGSVNAQSVTGTVRQEAWGSGTVRVGQ